MKIQFHPSRTFAVFELALLTMVLMTGPFGEAWAGTVYSYIDDQGNPVFTDTLDTVPEKYRAKVKTHERAAGPERQASVLGSVKQVVKEQATKLGLSLNPGQSEILTYAGGAAVVLLLMMYLSKSQLTRMLGFGLLIVMGIGVPVLMYVSDGGPMDRLKQKSLAAGQAQQNRVDQIPR